jgi:hypothetical protein
MQTEPTNADPPKPKRRWFQFSLRSLMIFTAIVALGMAHVGRAFGHEPEPNRHLPGGER